MCRKISSASQVIILFSEILDSCYFFHLLDRLSLKYIWDFTFKSVPGVHQEPRGEDCEEGGEEGEGELQEGAELEISPARLHEGGKQGQEEGRRQEQEQEQGAGAGAQLYGLRNPGYGGRALSRAVR